MVTHKSNKLGDTGKTGETILGKVEVIKKAGFGEVRILIRNGAVYRILTTEDEAVIKE